MTKTGIWAIAAVFAVLLIGISSQSAYAPPPNAIVFSFSGSTTDGATEITMFGQGAWKVAGKIGAGGTFTTTTGLTGNWHALSLYTGSNPLTTCPPCTTTTTSPSDVVFRAQFNPRGGGSFQADVVVGTGDIRTGTGATETFWVKIVSGTNFGFGTATSSFF